MSTPIYKTESAWRAFMLLEQSKNREAAHGISQTVAGALVIYLLSGVSRDVALALAIVLFAITLFAGYQNTSYRRRQLQRLQEDADLDL